MFTSYLSVVACQPNYISCKLSKQHIHRKMLHITIMCFAYWRQNDVTLHIGTCLKHVQSDIFPESNIFSGFLKSNHHVTYNNTSIEITLIRSIECVKCEKKFKHYVR